MNQFDTHGAFSWSELMTPDPAAAADYYAGLFGWTIEQMDMATGPYTVAKIGERPVAGMMAPPEEGIPTVWGFYVTVDDVDLIASSAVELGGSVEVPPMDIPDVGRLCGIQDPQGAFIFAVSYEPQEGDGQVDFRDAFTAHGAFSWFELRTPDVDVAKVFYGQLFGWNIVTEQMHMGPYSIVKTGDVAMGGMVTPPADNVPPHWGGYVTVDDTDATVSRAVDLGGAVLFGPFDIPDVGRFSMLQDPQGAALAVIAYVPVQVEEG